MPSQRLLLNELGELELAVLSYLWGVEETCVKELHQAIGRERRIGVNTIGSTLVRLHEKGLVTREKVSHAYQYAAVLSQYEFMVRRMLESVGPISRSPLDTFISVFLELLSEEKGNTALAQLEALVLAKRELLGKPLAKTSTYY